MSVKTESPKSRAQVEEMLAKEEIEQRRALDEQREALPFDLEPISLKDDDGKAKAIRDAKLQRIRIETSIVKIASTILSAFTKFPYMPFRSYV